MIEPNIVAEQFSMVSRTPRDDITMTGAMMIKRIFYQLAATKDGWVVRNAETNRIIYDRGSDGKPLDQVEASKLAAVLNDARRR